MNYTSIYPYSNKTDLIIHMNSHILNTFLLEYS
jgi:hypothetical protein